MTPERWERINELFHAALDLPPENTGEFLRHECAGDEEMYAEVARMVEEHGHSGLLDRSPIAGAGPGTALQGPVFLEGQLVAGRYRIVGFLNRGGMGEVYEAEDRELGEKVALKTLLPSIASDTRMIARFKQEIQLSRKISHPNVCNVFDLARHPADGSSPDPTFFLTMEFLPGETLAARLKREGRMSCDAALPLIQQMAAALTAAHQAGVIHRDFKPSNVMLVPAPEGTRAVVTDFGLARSFVSKGDRTVTLSGAVVGTLDYMAPELLTSQPASVASDVYALGMVAYRMVTGSLPFSSDTPLAGAILRGKVPVPPPKSVAPGLDPQWDRAILRALDADSTRRFPRPEDFIEALRGETASVTVSLPVMTRRRWALTATAVVALIVAVVGWRAWLHARMAPSQEALKWYQTGASALHDGTYYRAARALERSVAVSPGFALAHARLADAWNELDDSDKAKDEMLRAIPSSGAVLNGDDGLYLDAIHRTMVGDYPGAIQVYRVLAGRVPGADRPAVLSDLGRALERSDEIPKALDSYREAARLDPQNAAAHLRAAMILGLRQRKLSDAAAEFAQAESLYQSLSNVEGSAEVFFQRGLLASTVPTQLAEARKDLDKAVELSRAAATEYQEIAATLQLSVVTYQQGDSEGAARIAAAASERARHAGMANLAARGLIDLGNAQRLAGEPSLREALETARRFRMRRNEARALLSLASLHQQQGASDAVLKEAEGAISFYRPAGFRQETISCLTLIARAKRDQGHSDQALAAFQEHLSLARAADDRPQIAIAEQGLGTVLFVLDRWPEALQHYEAYYALQKSSGDRVGPGLGLINRAKVLWRLGRYSDAEQLLLEADGLASLPGSDSRLPSLIGLQRTQIELSRNSFRHAAANAAKVAAMKTVTPLVRANAQCLGGLAMARSGAPANGKSLCREGMAALAALGETADLAESSLTMAQILLAGGETSGAVEQVHEAVDAIGKARSSEAIFRVWAVAAQVYRKSGDSAALKNATDHAAQSLSDLRSALGAAGFDGYLQRPDISELQKLLRN